MPGLRWKRCLGVFASTLASTHGSNTPLVSNSLASSSSSASIRSRPSVAITRSLHRRRSDCSPISGRRPENVQAISRLRGGASNGSEPEQEAVSVEAASGATTLAVMTPTAAVQPKATTTKFVRTESKRTRHLIKYGSFALLVLQNSALTCTMRWSRAHVSGPLYSTSTAVVMCELCKIVASLLLLLVDKGGSLKALGAILQHELWEKPDECIKLLVPGLLYVLQNNLQYIAASNLQPAVFQVMYQVKMLTTAALSVTMLKKKLRPTQWGGVGLLTGGLVLVQLSQMTGIASSVAHGTPGNPAVGFAAILAACTLAGFAGCYLERVLQGCGTSLWVRNLQLSTWGILLGGISVAAKDGRRVAENGFFYGYSPVVWAVVGIQACGGLLISLVVRYGDALFKGFATGLALILTTAVSVAYFDFQVTPLYLAGASTTFFAVLLYSGLLPKLGRKLKAAAKKLSPSQARSSMGFPQARSLDSSQAAPCADDTGGSGTGSGGGGGVVEEDEISDDSDDTASPQLWSQPTGYPWSRVAFGGAAQILFLARASIVSGATSQTPFDVAGPKPLPLRNSPEFL